MAVLIEKNSGREPIRLPDTKTEGLPRIRWTVRRIVWVSAFVGVGLPLTWFLWGIFGWPAAILISRETTWLTEPVAEDGYVDYLPFIKARHLPQGVAPTETDHWLQLHEGERARERGDKVELPANIVTYRDPAVAFSEAQLQAQEDGDAEADNTNLTSENLERGQRRS